ncbi:MAG: TIGR01777 family oxidoreductase [Chitinophagales bacterium]|nr:TIGR01777 family oxidoreductase [Chitinophagales bacterium]
MSSILIAGGTGFVGTHLAVHLARNGYVVHVLSRNKGLQSTSEIRHFHWDIEKRYVDPHALEGVDTIINLSGANISQKRWTTQRKQTILDSRIQPLDLLLDYVLTHHIDVRTIISSSATGYYGACTSDMILTEKSLKGTDFLAEVCGAWENHAMKFADQKIKTIILRKGVIIGKGGGIYDKMTPMARLGVNVAVGSGKQYLPWMDIRDLVRLYDWLIKSETISGIFNTVAPENITMNDFSETLLKSFGKKNYLPNVPAFLIKLLYGQMSGMLLNGTRISAEKLLDAGFVFEYDTIEKSLFHV